MINSFKIFNIEIHFYSLCILLGIFLAYILIIKESKRHNIEEQKVESLIFYTILVGIVGARLYYVLFNLDYYSYNVKEIFMVWHGGLAIHGGIIGGLIFLYFYTKKSNLNYLKMIDISVPGLIIAQAIGRWGNFFNQEAYGSAVTKEFLSNLHIPTFIIDGMLINGSYHIPTFLFESILSVIGFIILLLIRKNKNIKIGTLTAFYAIWYGIVRFIIEIFRTDSLMLSSFKQAQIISIIFIAIGITLLLDRKRNLYKE